MIDSSNDLFIPFHYLVTSVINTLSESYYCHKNPAMFIASPVLDSWLKCQFTGKESFKEVQEQLFGINVTLGEYTQ